MTDAPASSLAQQLRRAVGWLALFGVVLGPAPWRSEVWSELRTGPPTLDPTLQLADQIASDAPGGNIRLAFEGFRPADRGEAAQLAYRAAFAAQPHLVYVAPPGVVIRHHEQLLQRRVWRPADLHRAEIRWLVTLRRRPSGKIDVRVRER